MRYTKKPIDDIWSDKSPKQLLLSYPYGPPSYIDDEDIRSTGSLLGLQPAFVEAIIQITKPQR